MSVSTGGGQYSEVSNVVPSKITLSGFTLQNRSAARVDTDGGAGVGGGVFTPATSGPSISYGDLTLGIRRAWFYADMAGPPAGQGAARILHTTVEEIEALSRPGPVRIMADTISPNTVNFEVIKL